MHFYANLFDSSASFSSRMCSISRNRKEIGTTVMWLSNSTLVATRLSGVSMSLDPQVIEKSLGP
jgi:hypothetical protein